MNRQRFIILTAVFLVLVSLLLAGCADKPKQESTQAAGDSGVEDVFLPDENALQTVSVESHAETAAEIPSEPVEETAINLPMIPMG